MFSRRGEVLFPKKIKSAKRKRRFVISKNIKDLDTMNRNFYKIIGRLICKFFVKFKDE